MRRIGKSALYNPILQLRKEIHMEKTAIIVKLYQEMLPFSRLQPKDVSAEMGYMGEISYFQRRIFEDVMKVLKNPKLAASCVVWYRVKIADSIRFGVKEDYFDSQYAFEEVLKRVLTITSSDEEKIRFYHLDTFYLEDELGQQIQYMAMIAFDPHVEESLREGIIFFKVEETTEKTVYSSVDDEELIETLEDKFFKESTHLDLFFMVMDE